MAVCYESSARGIRPRPARFGACASTDASTNARLFADRTLPLLKPRKVCPYVKFVLALVCILFASAAQASRCVAGDCRDGNGRAVFANGDAYAGEWRRGHMHGRGVYTYRSGIVYRGEFAGGKIDGRGTAHYPDGAIYAGQWRGNRKHGEGQLVLPSGKIVRGRWDAGRQVETDYTEAESVAVAEAAADAQGAVRPAAPQPGEVVEPPVAAALAAESEALRDCNAEYCADGRGRYEYRDGTVYAGDFEEGRPGGHGVVAYANGDRYEGEWADNGPDGEGTYLFRAGNRIAGKWRLGKLVRRRFNEAPGAVAEAEPATKAADGEATMYAVVVGVGTYDAMKSLRYTDDDAYLMYAFLKSPEGGALADEQIEVLVDERATRANIERALAEKLARADADDIVVFYYSGHGVDGYFVPVDFDGANNLLSHRRVEQLLESSSAKHKLVLADACHAGGLLAARSTEASATRLYEAFANSDGGTALLLSSRSEEVSLESRGLRSGVFSHYLMRGMRGEADADADAIVTVTELHAYVYDNVRTYTGGRQTPVLSGAFDSRMPVASLR